MPWRETSVMEERLRFVARLLEGEGMSEVCRDFGISRKTGYKIFNRYKDDGLEALTDRSRRPVRYANQLPGPVEAMIVRLKKEKPYWGARKIRELLVKKLAGDVRIPANSPCMRCSTAMALCARPARGTGQTRPWAPRCLRPSMPTICGAPTSRANSSLGTVVIVTH
jgi:transposase